MSLYKVTLEKPFNKKLLHMTKIRFFNILGGCEPLYLLVVCGLDNEYFLFINRL